MSNIYLYIFVLQKCKISCYTCLLTILVVMALECEVILDVTVCMFEFSSNFHLHFPGRTEMLGMFPA